MCVYLFLSSAGFACVYDGEVHFYFVPRDSLFQNHPGPPPSPEGDGPQVLAAGGFTHLFFGLTGALSASPNFVGVFQIGFSLLRHFLLQANFCRCRCLGFHKRCGAVGLGRHRTSGSLLAPRVFSAKSRSALPSYPDFRLCLQQRLCFLLLTQVSRYFC